MSADGKIKLFNRDSDHERAPVYKGTVRVDGENYAVALWPSKCGDGSVYTGTLTKRRLVQMKKGRSE